VKDTHHGYVLARFHDLVEDEVGLHRDLRIAFSELSGGSSSQLSSG
jgi:hypothetical protein